MKVFSVFGITKSGKTTVLEKVIAELRRRRFSVGSVKDIHFEKFAMDTEGTNTHRHKMAGSQLVTARGLRETDILFPRQLTMEEILTFYDHDYVAIEGKTDLNVPRIITAHNTQEIDERLDDSVFAISGIIACEINSYRGLPVINAVTGTEDLVDLIQEKVPALMPDMAPECCSACGKSCRELLASMLQGGASRSDCILDKADVKLTIGGQDISMVPFVQNVLRSTLTAMVSTLDGYKEHADISITIKGSKNDD